MIYRVDDDLEFLSNISSSELDTLVGILTKNKDGEVRLTENLTNSERYKTHSPDHAKYWDLIAAELQCFGANTFATIIRRGEGVVYKNILINVCKKMKVNFNKSASTAVIEMNLLMKILTKSMKDLNSSELKEIVEELNLNTTSFTSQAVIVALQGTIRMGGFASYQVAVIVANAVARNMLGHGLTFATNAAITRTMSILAGPIGWVVAGLWTLVDIAGPAYRVTIPSVIQVAFLRAKFNYEEANR